MMSCLLSIESNPTPGSIWSQSGNTVFGDPAGASGSDAAHLNSPIGMYYDQSNNILVVADFGNDRVLKFACAVPSSTSAEIAGANGDDCQLNQFQGPVGVALDSTGQLYATDPGCDRIVQYPADSDTTASGVVAASIANPEQLFINPLTNDIYVAGHDDHAVYKLAGGSGPLIIVAGI